MRAFIAISLDELKEHFLTLQQKLEPESAKFSLAKSFHITLKFLGELEDDEIYVIKEVIRTVKFKPFTLEISTIGAFPSMDHIRVIWAKAESKDGIKLQNDIEKALERFNIRKDNDFKMHITLARVGAVKDRERLRRNINNMKAEKRTFHVNSFKLMKSTLTNQGPVYEVIEEYMQNQ